MRTQFDNQLRELNIDMIKMASTVEEAINKSVTALINRDGALAQEIITEDRNINDMERQIERRCLKLLLQQQPVARDLRRISSALKMITDMERIGDHATDISEITKRFVNEELIKSPEHIRQMANATTKMVKDCIDAFVNNDEEAAKAVIKEDDIVDDLFNRVKAELIEMITEDKTVGEQAIDLLMIAKYFERIGDHAVNIAEWVVFSITGYHKDSAIM